MTPRTCWPSSRRSAERIVELLPDQQRPKVRALLGYDPAEAGGLMSPDFISVYRQATVGEALDRVRRSTLSDELLNTIFVMDSRHRLVGAVPLAKLVRADPESGLAEVGPDYMPSLIPDADFEEVARLMADYDLICAPVVDSEERMIGVVTVDDVLEVMLPKGWRRHFGLLGED